MPNRSDVWLYNYQEDLKKLKEELEEILSEDIL